MHCRMHFVIVLLVFMLLSVSTARSETTVNQPAGTGGVEGYLEIGGRAIDIDGSREKFLEYRDLRSGVLIEDFLLRWESERNPAFLDLRIKKPLFEDEFYRIDGGMYGKYKYRLFYDSLPHTYSRGRFIFSGFEGNYLSIPDNIQTSLEAVEQTRLERGSNPLIDNTGEDALAQAIVRNLYSASGDVTFKVIRKQSGVDFEYDFAENLKFWLKMRSERRDGAKVINTGTYERFPQTGIITGLTGTQQHTADLFMVSGAELAEPIDYVTTSITAGTGIFKKTWAADLEYTFTDFKNEFAALRWDNPFRISDATATNAAGAVTSLSDNAFNRGRFVTGQLALPPDSVSHDVRVSASVHMAMRSSLVLNAGYGRITQDEAFLPYTLNTAISGTVGAPPANITDPAVLPARDLQGEVKTQSYGLVFTTRPADPFTVTAKYRYYQYDDKSLSIQFPGYVAFGESFWRTKKNDPGVNNVRNEPFAYTKQNADIGVDYHMTKAVSVGIEGGWEAWDYDELRIENSDEYSLGASMMYKPSRASQLKLAYRHAERDSDGYVRGATAENPEAIGLESFNWADRDRDRVEARYQMVPGRGLTIGLLGRYYEDDYGEDNRFGLTEVKDTTGAVDLAYSPSEAMTVYTNFSREYRKDFIRNGAKDDTFNVTTSALDDPFASDQFNPFNYWNTNIRETINTVGVGVRWQVVPRRMELDTSYNYSVARMRFHNYNPNAGEAQAAVGQDAKLMNAIAQPWPDVYNRYHELRANLSYAFTENVSAGLRYLYEWYKLNDFQWNLMEPYMAGATAENLTRYVFTDATYNKYEAHMGTLTVTYKF